MSKQDRGWLCWTAERRPEPIRAESEKEAAAKYAAEHGLLIGTPVHVVWRPQVVSFKVGIE